MNDVFESSDGWLQVAALVAVLVAWMASTLPRLHRRHRHLMGPDARPFALLPDAMLVATCLLIGLALCGPLLGRREVRVDARGIDVVFALDVSRSMDATDNPPSRAQRAQALADRASRGLEPGDRAGLVAFAGSAVRLAPLTPDRDVLGDWLARIDGTTVGPRGSNLAAGLSTALSLFDFDAERRRVILLVGDGEWSAGGVRDLEALAARHGVQVHSALFGTDTGVTIPDHGVVVIGPDGRPALTRRVEARARSLADETGGEVFLADRWGRIDAEVLEAALRRGDTDGLTEAYTESRRAPLTWPFTALAFLLLALEGPLRDRRTWGRMPKRRTNPLIDVRDRATPHSAFEVAALRGRRSGETAVRPTPRAITLCVFAAMLLGASTPTDDASDVAPDWLRAGARAVEAGEDEAARRAFERAAATATTARWAGTAHYQLGVWHLKHDDPASAETALLESLRLHPGQFDAAFNLEWAQLALAAREGRSPDEPEPLFDRSDTRTEDAADETSNEPEATDPETRSPEYPETRSPQQRPSSQIRPTPDGSRTRGPNPDAGASGRALPDEETLSWWLDLVIDDPSRGQRIDPAQRHGPEPGGPPW